MSYSGQSQFGQQPARPKSTRDESRKQSLTLSHVNIPTDNRHETSSVQQSPSQPHFRVPQSPRSSIGETQAKAAKVAIPRIKRAGDNNSEGVGRGASRHRVNHACEPCRQRKTKCSGEKPICRHCQDFRITCHYADGKRDRAKKQFGTMAEKVAEYERILNELIDKVSEEDASLIRASLDKAAQSDVDETATDAATLPSIELNNNDEAYGAEAEAPADAGSTGAVDRADEDFTQDGANLSGFLGKSSEVTWMQRVRQETRYGDDPPPGADEETRKFHRMTTDGHHEPKLDLARPLAEAREGFSIQESSYHLDDLTISTFDGSVDMFELPLPETATLLFETYMQRVHPSFPVVGQVNLTFQFQRFISNPSQRPPEKWLAILNLIFAIGAKYSHLVQAEWRGDERDHLIYFTRARLLALAHEVSLEHPDLQHIQILGLMSFYLLSTSQINRSWMLVGRALRAAVALGLNLRNETAKLKEGLKEIRYRLWWALCSLEFRLCSITGRMSCVIDDHCTTPLPCPVEESSFETSEGKRFLSEEMQQHSRSPSTTHQQTPVAPPHTLDKFSDTQSLSNQSDRLTRSPSAIQSTVSADLEWARDVAPNSALYFLHMVQITRLMQSIYHQLYSPIAIKGVWAQIQIRITHLNSQLDSWYRNLPPVFDFRRKQRDRDFYEARLALGFYYYSTKQMIYRPCLCRLDRKIKGQSDKSQDFNRLGAMSCVEAAQETLRLIPDEPNAVGLISVGPWWAILHWLVQATSVLMLETSFRAFHMPDEADSILESSKKAVRWLHALGEENLSARRAWKLCNNMLHETAARIGRSVNDVPSQPPGKPDMSPPDIMGTRSGANNTAPSPGMQASPGQTFHQPASNHGPGGHVPGGFHSFNAYDAMMHYDQYFPSRDTLQTSMPPTHMGSMYVPNQDEAGLDYMAVPYHDAGRPGRDGHGQGHGHGHGQGPHTGVTGGQYSNQMR